MNSIKSVIKRNGRLENFDSQRIENAIAKAFVACGYGNSTFFNELPILTNTVVKQLQVKKQHDKIAIADIQIAVENALMDSDFKDVARAYIEYRASRDKTRHNELAIEITRFDGAKQLCTDAFIHDYVAQFFDGFHCDYARVEHDLKKNLYQDITEFELLKALLLSIKSFMSFDLEYDYAAARVLLKQIEYEVLIKQGFDQESYFENYINRAVVLGILHFDMLKFDLHLLAQRIDYTRDSQFRLLGLQTLYDRYLQKKDGQLLESPQIFFMRVAMGIAIQESAETRDEYAIEFYETLSQFKAMSSTPTLFNSGTRLPQLSSCYISTVHDSTEGITQTIMDNAKLSKFAGGIGNDWTMVRAIGAHIKSTNGKSGGVIPFLKMAESTLQAFNQSGKRKGSGCAYLEIWHLDIDLFLELRKNTGDERRRTHDMDTAVWIPDLFMERVYENNAAGSDWTLFSPDECYVNGKHIHEMYGEEFKNAYLFLESQAKQGKIKRFQTINAVTLWRKLLNLLFESGHPWICFKDAVNFSNTQEHIGAILSSNLCTEITEVTKPDNGKMPKETAVCNLASINLESHILPIGTDDNGEIIYELDGDLLRQTVRTTMRMLDNVIDINFYPVDSAEYSNKQHRPVGLGLMGFQNALYLLKIPYSSERAVQFADRVQEIISYYAIEASCDLASERGAYKTFVGSKWSKGILPIDSYKKSQESRHRGFKNDIPLTSQTALYWNGLRERVKQGMRNSNCMAIAPTATISNIVGTSQSIEPMFENIFVKSNLSGDFTVLNKHLVYSLKQRGLWTERFANDLKKFGGDLTFFDIPQDIKELYQTAFQVDMMNVIRCAAARQKWIDQSQSVNFYLEKPSGKRMDALYKYAWQSGLKTTYYLRTKAATQVKPANVDTNENYSNCPIDGSCESCQ